MAIVKSLVSVAWADGEFAEQERENHRRRGQGQQDECPPPGADSPVDDAPEEGLNCRLAAVESGDDDRRRKQSQEDHRQRRGFLEVEADPGRQVGARDDPARGQDAQHHQGDAEAEDDGEVDGDRKATGQVAHWVLLEG